jgi:hypothetical protein
MSKTKFLTGAVVILVLLNGAMLSMLWKRPAPPHLKGPRNIIIERLHFDKEQVAAYDKLVEKHRADIRQKDSEMAAARQAIYHQLQEDDFSEKDSLLAQVGRLQMEVEEIHLAHFQDIKGLCREEQVEDFRKLSTDLGRLFGKPKQPKK